LSPLNILKPFWRKALAIFPFEGIAALDGAASTGL